MQCEKCGHVIQEAAKFCSECGHRLQRPRPDTETLPEQTKTHPTLAPERKHVTVLFSDLTGYTSITEKLDPEQVKELTGSIFTGIKRIVARYEGFIERVMGDGVVAFFGVPQSHEDDPIRAVRTAMEIHDHVKSLSSRYETWVGAPLSMHSGINTGLVVTADVDAQRGTHGIAGDAVNVAARLSGLAAPGEILLGEATVRRARKRFEFQDLGPRQVKGKTDPVSVFKLVAARAPSPGIGAERQVFSEMVGRDKELDLLELQVMKVINGDGSVVNVVGEAGIGKSRLIVELRKREVMKRVLVLEGRAISMGKNLSFHPIIDLMKQWAGIAEDDSESTGSDKLERVIRAIHPEEAYEILPFLGTLMGMKLKGRHAERVKGIEGEGLEKLILKNVRDLLIKGSERRPTVIIVEDLHWADESSLGLLESLYPLAENNRVLFINVFRPGYWQGESRVVEKISSLLPNHHVEIVLQPLDREMSEVLIGNMLNIKGLPHSLRVQISERAGGNPFFIEEVIRSLIDQGAIVPGKGKEFEVTAKINSVVVPHTINDVLMARIDRLEERTRELVKCASVIGRSFFDRILKDVAASVEDIDSKLNYLKDLQLIRDRVRMEELEYLFKHALAQEVAYQSTLLQQRKEIHLKVARSIEKLFQDRLHEFYGMLAYHYSKAEDLEKTEEYLIKAGEESLRASASTEALHYYQQALDLYLSKHAGKADPAKVAMLEKNIALALFSRGLYAEAIPHFDKVLAFYGETTPKHQIGKILKLGFSFLALVSALYLPFLYWKKDPTEEDNEFFNLYYKKCAALSVTDPKEWFSQALYFYRRFIKLDMKKIDTGPGFASIAVMVFAFTGISFTLSRKVLALTKNKIIASDVTSMFIYQCNLLYNNGLSGEWKDEIEIDQDLVDKNIAIGEFFYIPAYMLLASFLHIERGNFRAAHGLVRQLSDIGEIYENNFCRAVKYLVSGTLFVGYRKLHDAMNEVEKGIFFIERTNLKVWLILMVSLKARIQILLGNINESEDSFEYAEKVMFEIAEVPMYRAYLTVSKFLYELHKLEEARREADKNSTKKYSAKAISAGKESLKMANKYSFTKTETLKLMGAYYWIIEKQRKAMKWWHKAIQEGRRMNYRLELSRTYFEVGKRLLEPKSRYKELDGVKAEEYLEKAKVMFEEMDLQWDLDELEKFKMHIGS